MNDSFGDFSEKLDFLRKTRNDHIVKSASEILELGLTTTAIIENLITAIDSLRSSETSTTKFVVYWMKSPTKGKLFHKGPYVQLKRKVRKTGKWKTIHLGSLVGITNAKIKEKTNIGFVDISCTSLSNLLNVKQLFVELLPIINLMARMLKLYQVKLISQHDPTWKSLIYRLIDASYLIEAAMLSDLKNMNKLEAGLDKGMLKFNQVMRRRYRSFFVKWNVNPTSKKVCMGQGLAEMYIVTKLSSDQRFVKTVKQFKKTLVEDGPSVRVGRSTLSPWVTNRLLRVGRASALRKRLMGIQTNIKEPLAVWETSYNRLLVASTNLTQFQLKR